MTSYWSNKKYCGDLIIKEVVVGFLDPKFNGSYLVLYIKCWPELSLICHILYFLSADIIGYRWCRMWTSNFTRIGTCEYSSQTSIHWHQKIALPVIHFLGGWWGSWIGNFRKWLVATDVNFPFHPVHTQNDRTVLREVAKHWIQTDLQWNLRCIWTSTPQAGKGLQGRTFVSPILFLFATTIFLNLLKLFQFSGTPSSLGSHKDMSDQRWRRRKFLLL